MNGSRHWALKPANRTKKDDIMYLLKEEYDTTCEVVLQKINSDSDWGSVMSTAWLSGVVNHHVTTC